MNAAAKTYVIRFTSAMLAYSVLLVAAVMLVQRIPWGNPLRYALMILPVVPIIFGLLAFVRFFESMDEMQKTIHLYALAFAFAASGLLSFTYGLLETVGLPHLSWVWIFPMMIAFWGIGSWLAARKYR